MERQSDLLLLIPLMASKLYGLLGFPLGHSFSWKYFSDKFERGHIDAEYRNFEIPDIGDFIELLAEYPDLAGLNVTIPYKRDIIPYMDEMDGVAEKIGAVNVIRFTYLPDGSPWLKGYNSDVIGFRDSVAPLLSPSRRKALILGTGGASKAIAEAFAQLGVDYLFVSRNPDNGSIAYSDLIPEVMESHLVIVNATPLGMYPDIDSCPPIPYNCLTPLHLCYDLVYNPEETLFMKKAAEAGAEVKNGHEMLVRQAEAAWAIWNS